MAFRTSNRIIPAILCEGLYDVKIRGVFRVECTDDSVNSARNHGAPQKFFTLVDMLHIIREFQNPCKYQADAVGQFLRWSSFDQARR